MLNPSGEVEKPKIQMINPITEGMKCYQERQMPVRRKKYTSGWFKGIKKGQEYKEGKQKAISRQRKGFSTG